MEKSDEKTASKRKADPVDEAGGIDDDGIRAKKLLTSQENALENCFTWLIGDVMGYTNPCFDMPKKGLKIQREFIVSRADNDASRHTFNIAKAAFYRGILTDDSTKRLKYGIKVDSSLTSKFLNCALVESFKKIFGPIDPKINLDHEDTEIMFQTLPDCDESKIQGPLLLIWVQILKALWNCSVEELARDSYEYLLIDDPDLPKNADLPTMMKQPSVKSAVDSAFSQNIHTTYLQSPLRFSLFQEDVKVGRFASGGLKVFKDNDIINGLYKLASKFVDITKSDEDICASFYDDFKSQLGDVSEEATASIQQLELNSSDV